MASTAAHPAGRERVPGGLVTRQVRQVRILTELEHLLDGPQCPACQYIDEAERSFFSWFAIESYTTTEVQARLRASMGMCAAHLRRLIDEVSQTHILTTVMRHAVVGAQARLRDEIAAGVCPGCQATTSAAGRVSQLVAEGLLDPAHARLYAEHQGLCLVHLLQAIAVADQPVVKLLAERMLSTLDENGDGMIIERLAGADRDSVGRAARREGLPDEQTTESIVAGLSARLGLAACPVCLATGRMQRRYVRWFCERTSEHDPSLETDPGELCAAHLHDIAIADPQAAIEASHRKSASARAELRRLVKTVSRFAPGPRRRGNRTPELDGARAELLAEHHCSACHAATGVDDSQLSLLAASVAVAPIRDLYHGNHGACARHALLLANGSTARLIKQHADARLGLLLWELQETARKHAWAYRHESSGTEHDAWLRAAVHIDGRVFEGGPAPTMIVGLDVP